jgi:hypothetical protein
LRHAFIEVPAVSVVKVEMIEEVFNNNEFNTYVFHGWEVYDKKFIFKAKHQQKQVEEITYFIC